MNETKHTPGPWTIETNVRDTDLSAIIFCREDHSVATVFVRDATGDGMANARLIAAAPAMLEALKALVLDVVDPKDGAPPYRAPRQVHIDNARTAIAQAEK